MYVKKVAIYAESPLLNRNKYEKEIPLST